MEGGARPDPDNARPLRRSAAPAHPADLRRKDLDEITPPAVRTWRAERLKATGATTVAKSYRLLKAILQTAVDDDLLGSNPCRIKGAGKEEADERPTATIEQVFDLADAMDPRWRLMVLLGAFASLHPEELAELRRRSVGKNEVDGLLFVGEKGAPFRRSTFGRKWRKARTEVGMPDNFRFYDLRHTGNTLAADTDTDPDQNLTVWTAAPGSATHARLRILASWAADQNLPASPSVS
ncbi:tyrosine recombinase XerC [Streptomyces sp. RLB1-33]|uniref:site-specific integrase n=1 Tax=Streptomyces mirabilis TaxID=68239 RepID=UPI002001E0B3|nr:MULTISPECIES: hypothetical protein [Streptomyces]